MNTRLENSLIYYGFRFGILATALAFLILIGIAFGVSELSKSITFWIVAVAVVSTSLSKLRWNYRYTTGQSVPCFHCSKKFTNKTSHLSPAGSYRYAEVQCPHCKKMIAY